MVENIVTEKQLEKKEKELEKKEQIIEKKEQIIEKKIEVINKKELLLDKAKASAKKLGNEFNKAMNTAILAAFGFLIALVWKDVITEYVNKVTAFSPVQGKLISALLITFVCVIGIIVIAKILPFEK